MSSAAQRTRSFVRISRTVTRERHLEILMPMDLHPVSDGCWYREITFYDPLAHSYRRIELPKNPREFRLESFRWSISFFFGFGEITHRNKYKKAAPVTPSRGLNDRCKTRGRRSRDSGAARRFIAESRNN